MLLISISDEHFKRCKHRWFRSHVAYRLLEYLPKLHKSAKMLLFY